MFSGFGAWEVIIFFILFALVIGAINSARKKNREKIGAAKYAESKKGPSLTSSTVTPDNVKKNRPVYPQKNYLLLMLFLTYITYSLYVPIWFIRRTNYLNGLGTEKQVNKGLANIFLIIWILMWVCLFYGIAEGWDDAFTTFMWVIVLAYTINGITLVFQMRAVLNEFMNKYRRPSDQLDGFLTFIFNMYYIQYRLNRLDSDYVSSTAPLWQEPAPSQEGAVTGRDPTWVDSGIS